MLKRLLVVALPFAAAILAPGQIVSAQALGDQPEGRVRAGYAEVREPLLYYEEKGSGPPLVLIHGGALDRRMWDEQLEVFSKNYRVIRYDVRGFGKSTIPTRPYSHVQDLHDLLRFLKIDQACIVGLSLGSMIAVDFALTYPEMTSALVLAGPAVNGFAWNPADEKQVRKAIRLAVNGDNNQAIDVLMQDPYLASAALRPDLASRMRAMATDNLQSMLVSSILERPVRPAAIKRLKEIHVPTLVIIGTRDTADSQKNAELLKTQVPNCQRIDIGGAGHLVNLEKPKEFDAAVLAFLADRAEGRWRSAESQKSPERRASP
jgi:pimeloyl-ACP methyl ester carboxylesterase